MSESQIILKAPEPIERVIWQIRGQKVMLEEKKITELMKKAVQ